MPDGERPWRKKVPRQPMRTRLSVPGWARQGAARARLASSPMTRRLWRVTYSSRPPELVGPLLPDTTAWQGVVRTAQTPAFRAALVAALSVAWIGTATLSGSSGRQPPPPAAGQVESPVSSAVEPMPSADPTVNAAPPGAAQAEVSDEFLKNYAKVAAELDRQAGRIEVSAAPQPATPTPLCPACTDSLSPGPEQTLNEPPTTVAAPAAPPIPIVAEPSPHPLRLPPTS